jgi:hypothetical protein
MKDSPRDENQLQGKLRLAPVSEGIEAARQAAVLAERPSGVPSSQQIFRDRVAEVYGPKHNRTWTPEMLAASETKSTAASGGASPTTPETEL